MIQARICILYLAAAGGLAFAQSYSGGITSADCTSLTGKATVNGQPSAVDLYSDGVYLGTARAGFSWVFTIPAALKGQSGSRNFGHVQRFRQLRRRSGAPRKLAAERAVLRQLDRLPVHLYGLLSGGFELWRRLDCERHSFDILPRGGFSTGNTLQSTGSVIATSSITPPTPSGFRPYSDYELSTALTIVPSAEGGRSYIQYLRASSGAPFASNSTYFAVSVTVQCYGAGPCTASLSAYEMYHGAQITLLQSVPVTCWNNMTVRTVVFGNAANILVNGKVYQVGVDVISGLPGIGGEGLNDGNVISQVQFGRLDTFQPSAVNPNNPKAFTTTVYPNSVTAEWQAAVDNPSDGNGVGVVSYSITQQCFAGNCTGGTFFTSYDASVYDNTVQPGALYRYSIAATDFHGNLGPSTSFWVATPPAGSIDPHRVGVQRTGNYWGGAGEHIDLVSGNLNFTIPLVTAVGRNGLTATFALSHNSQNWRNAYGINRMLGADTGYGFGWQLMLGSLLPVWGTDSRVQFYLYTDSTGAQYRLDQDNGSGVWGSLNSVYVWYDSNTNRLHFPSGTFWVMGCTSAGAEQDAGTLYPTVVEDSNGNQIIIAYLPGGGAAWNNSSSRINTIEDARAQLAYQFSYSTTPGQDGTTMSYLSGIASYVGTQENYAVNIAPGQALYAPDNSTYAYTTAGMLKSVTATGPVNGYANLGYSWTFSYEQPATCNNPPCLGDGSLTEVQLPQGGSLQWSYSPFVYVGTTTLWEVSSRNLQSVVGGSPPPPNAYKFTRPSADVSGGITVHSGMTLQDPTGAQKSWSFYCTNPSGYNNCPTASSLPRLGWAVNCKKSPPARRRRCATRPIYGRRIRPATPTSTRSRPRPGRRTMVECHYLADGANWRQHGGSAPKCNGNSAGDGAAGCCWRGKRDSLQHFLIQE